MTVKACGVCRTDLHVYDGELAEPKLPLVHRHEIVGTIAAVGAEVTGLAPGARVGIPWLGQTCRSCRPCANASSEDRVRPPQREPGGRVKLD